MMSYVASMLVLVTFHWNVQRLSNLQTVVDNVMSYPTHVRMVVVTNEPERLQRVMSGRDWDQRVKVWKSIPALAHPFELSHIHRNVIELVIKKHPGRFRTIMYLEDDILISWQSLLSWAEDTTYLAPKGFQRGFQRTEVAPWDGCLMSLDQGHPISLATVKTIVVESATGPRHFLALPNPYMGMWIAEASQLARFMNSSMWTKKQGPWDVREMAAGAMQFVNVPPGFFSEVVVPYDPKLKQVDDLVAISHTTNNYCGRHSSKPAKGVFCSLRWDQLLND